MTLKGEDDTFNALRRIPFLQVLNELPGGMTFNELDIWLDERGWTYTSISEHLTPALRDEIALAQGFKGARFYWPNLKNKVVL